MSSTSTTKDTGENVATSENPIKGIGEANSVISVKDELLSQEEASNNGTQATTVEIESDNVPVVDAAKKKEAAAAKSKPKKAEAAATKSKLQKAEAAATKSNHKKAGAEVAKSKPQKVEAAATKSKPQKAEVAKSKTKKAELETAKPEKVAQKKSISSVKGLAVNGKKIKLASSTYHYYRNWLAEFMRSHGVPSAKFQKAPENYTGHIIVLETEKEKGLKALEQWTKQNADSKELFWDVKK